mmetsp:Transcript_2993/g.4560  ORF Transcript_2993/g.4560 Transcript_2993/m.4560 type:complete len:415 (-) Transcript_2993:522-1766(-)
MKDQELRERGEWQIRESTIQCSINVMEAGQPMAEDTFLPRVRYVKVVNGNSMKTLALIEGICDKQIGMLIQAAFKLSAPVCVLRDCKTNINIPLSILCGASSQFEECRFSLVAPAFSAAQPLRSDICAFGGESKRGYDKNERGNNDLEEDLVEGGRGMEGFVATVRNCHSRRPPRSANVPTTHRSRSQPLRVINQRKKRINAPMHLWNSDDSSHIGNDIPRTAIKNSEESSSTNDTFDYSTRGGRVLRHSRQSKRQGVMENIWTKGIKHNSHRHQSRSPVLKLHPREIDRILEVRQTTLLSKLTASQVRKLYHQCKDKEGLITKKALEKRVQCFIPGQGLAHYTHVQRTINEIMGTFDLHGNGVIDAKEFLVGMSVLCNGKSCVNLFVLIYIEVVVVEPAVSNSKPDNAYNNYY